MSAPRDRKAGKEKMASGRAPDRPLAVTMSVTSLGRHDTSAGARVLANEVPVSVAYGGEPHAVMMVTPDHLEDFIVGFSLTERIVPRAEDILLIELQSLQEGVVANVEIPAECLSALEKRRRAIPGRSGCGMCGIADLEQALPELAPLSGCPPVTRQAIFAAVEALAPLQSLNAQTGAVHAAAYCRSDGKIVAAREDVGRHNALDKLIGYLVRTRTDCSAGFALLTSRCSYELVQKTVMARIPLLVTISAPTALAVEIAHAAKLTLIALARSDSMLCLSDPFDNFGGVV
jgi:FdhD protein